MKDHETLSKASEEINRSFEGFIGLEFIKIFKTLSEDQIKSQDSHIVATYY